MIRRKKFAILSTLLLLMASFPGLTQTGGQNNIEITTIVPQSNTAAIPIAVPVGSQFVINLPSNQTTGYKWIMSGKGNPKVLKMVKNVYNEPSNPMPGKGGSESWTFKAVGKGKVTIVLNYARPWEKNTPPAKTQTFNISVQ